MLIVLGVLLLLTPFSGLPVAIRTLLTVALGALVVGIGIFERSKVDSRTSTPPHEPPVAAQPATISRI
jgi:hypothetical protein